MGQWTENNIIYTYAKRLDVPTYECFLGALASADEIFIKEAGEDCRRDIDPYRYSMQLNKTSGCPSVETKVDAAAAGAASHVLDNEKPSLSPSQPSSAASAPASYETTSSSNNGDVEYEYFDDNHLNIQNGQLPSTETKVQVHTKDGAIDSQNTIDERANNDLYHVHPKIDAGTATKTENTSTSPNRGSRTQYNDVTLIASLLLLPLFVAKLFQLAN